MPALTQAFANGGLIPLGRKGEASQEKHAIGEEPPDYDQTRGPDTQIPVWVDRLKDIDFKKVASLFPDAQHSLEKILHSKSKSQETTGQSDFSYEEPNNPIIPLSGQKEDPRSSGYFPYSSGYFPSSEKRVPILKFDHPIHPQLPPDTPILLPTDPRKRHTGNSKPKRKTEGFEPLFVPAVADSNIRRETVSLRPNEDYQFTGNTLLEVTTRRKPAFPGIEATIRNEYLEPATANTPPSLDFEDRVQLSSNYQYENQYEDQYEVEPNPFPLDLPEYLDEYGYLKENAFIKRSSTSRPQTEKPQTTTAKRIPMLDLKTTAFNEVSTGTERNKPTTTSFYDPRRGSQAKKEKEFVDYLLKQNNEYEYEDIYEVTTPQTIKLESTEINLGIDVAHKGTPKEELTEPIEDTVFTTEKPQYEYEYEYEYVYEDELEEGEEFLPTSTETSSKETLASILNFLNKESTTARQNSREESLRTSAIGNLVPLSVAQNRQPTPLPPIRSSTFLYDLQGNYPEVQRSTVTVEIEDRFGRSRSSLSPEQGPTARSNSPPNQPFHPDRMDPASSPHEQGEGGDNSVNWYYSSYNNENSDPYIGPGGGRARSGTYRTSPGRILPLALTLLVSLLV